MSSGPAARSGAVGSLILTLLAGLFSSQPAWAAEKAVPERVDPARWMRLGSFRGSASSQLAQEAKDLLFGIEQDGDLYQDLGNVTLGLGVDPDDFKLDWDNSFFRRVEPLHQQLPLGSTLTAEDLSRYVDIQGMISRVTLQYGTPEDLTGDLVLGAKAEKGWALTLARARRPLVFGERPLAEVLAEREVDDFQEIVRRPEGQDPDLVELTAEGVAGLARWIAQGLATSVDTERGAIFFENAADPITLYYDVGIPIPTEMFTAADKRLSEGDRVRQLTFAAFSPLTAGIKEHGLEFGYEGFFRFLRETTIIKEPDNHVLVGVRHVLLKGHELKPLKIRPTVRLLGIVRLGYTLFEQRNSRGGTASSGLVYRIDLSNPQGFETLSALLGEGTDIHFRPLMVAADRGEGAELVSEETRRGSRRSSSLRIRFSSPLRFDHRKMHFSDEVKVGDVVFRELGLARMRRFRSKIGRNRDWTKQYLVSSQGKPPKEGQGNQYREAQKPTGEGAIAVNLFTGFLSKQAPAGEVRRQARLLAHGLGPHPVLERLASMDETERSDFFVSLRVSFGPDHLRHFLEADEQEVWVELAEILLGTPYGDAWATPEAQRLWKRRRHRKAYQEMLGDDLDSLPRPTRRRPGLKDRFQLAKRAVKKYDRARELIRSGDCLPCLSDVASKEKDIVLMQMLLYRLAAESGGPVPGYSYEIFAQPLLSPVTVTNEVEYDFSAAGEGFEEFLGESAPVRETRTEEAMRRITSAQAILGGTKTLVQASDARLEAGDLFLNVDPEAPADAAPFMLRLFSDYRFSPELSLRIDLRESKPFHADVALGNRVVALGEPAGLIETPFMIARYYYDIPLTAVAGLVSGEGYTLLLRVLNPDGRPVSEEQQLRFLWPTPKEVTKYVAERAEP
jgi:hypothetical protein